MLQDFLANNIFHWLLVFARLSIALMLFPGLGDNFVAPKVRLIFVLGLSILIVPVVQEWLPAQMPTHVFDLFILIVKEFIIGLFLGFIIRIIVAALEVAGMMIAYQIGLSNASVFNPAISMQTSLPGVFIGMLGIVIIFLVDAHHYFIRALVESYQFFPPNVPLKIADYAMMSSRYFADAFTVGIKMTAPFLVVGPLFYFSLGILSRLMPQLQVFFILMPAQILLGLSLMGITVSAMMLYWLDYLQAALQQFLSL